MSNRSRKVLEDILSQRHHSPPSSEYHLASSLLVYHHHHTLNINLPFKNQHYPSNIIITTLLSLQYHHYPVTITLPPPMLPTAPPTEGDACSQNKSVPRDKHAAVTRCFLWLLCPKPPHNRITEGPIRGLLGRWSSRRRGRPG